MSVNRKSQTALLYILIVPIVVFVGYPLVWMVLSSLKDNFELFHSPWALPEDFLLENWGEAWIEGNLARYYVNSILVTVLSVGLVLAISSPAAFAFARLRFRGRDFYLSLLLLGLILNPMMLIIPLYHLLGSLRLLNTYPGLVFPYVAWGLALSIYLLRSFFIGIPSELHDAAIMDGCSTFFVFWRVMLPLVQPALITVGIINSIRYWNELLLALLLLQDVPKRTLPAGLIFFSGEHVTDYGLVFAGISIATLPIIILYFVFQRRMTAGLTMGALR